MSRPARNRLLVMVVLVVAFALAPRLPTVVTWVVAAIGAPLVALAVWVTTPFRRARALIGDGRYEDAAVALREFEAVLAVGWKRALASLAVGFYTSNPGAAAKSTLGAVRLDQQQLGAATALFDEAITMDGEYAIPYANLAVIAAMEGDAVNAERLRLEATKRGYRFSLSLRGEGRGEGK